MLYLSVDDWWFQYQDEGETMTCFFVETAFRKLWMRSIGTDVYHRLSLFLLVVLRGRVSRKFDIYLRTQIGPTLRSFEQLFSTIPHLRTRAKHDSDALSLETAPEKALAVQIPHWILRASEFLYALIEDERHPRSRRWIHLRSVYKQRFKWLYSAIQL